MLNDEYDDDFYISIFLTLRRYNVMTMRKYIFQYTSVTFAVVLYFPKRIETTTKQNGSIAGRWIISTHGTGNDQMFLGNCPEIHEAKNIFRPTGERKGKGGTENVLDRENFIKTSCFFHNDM